MSQMNNVKSVLVMNPQTYKVELSNQLWSSAEHNIYCLVQSQLSSAAGSCFRQTSSHTPTVHFLLSTKQ